MRAKITAGAAIGVAALLTGGAYVFAQEGGEAAAPAAVEAVAAGDVDGAAAPAFVDQKMIDLGAAFPDNGAAASRMFRARKIALPPGARTDEIVGAERPSIFYVTKGAVVEHRSDQGAPVAHAFRTAAAISKGATSWVENAGTEDAEILLVDILAK